MSRLDYLTIAIVTVCIAALIFLIWKTTGLLSGSEADSGITPTEESTTDNFDDTYNPSSDFPEDSTYQDDTFTDEDYLSDDMDDEEASQNLFEEDEDDDFPESLDSDKGPADLGDGNYSVIAGTFDYLGNAEDQVRKLRRLGYDEAQVKKMDRGRYAVALVRRTETLEEAKELQRELEDKGVEAYIKELQ